MRKDQAAGPVGERATFVDSDQHPQAPKEDPAILRGADGVVPPGEGCVREKEPDVEGCTGRRPRGIEVGHRDRRIGAVAPQ